MCYQQSSTVRNIKGGSPDRRQIIPDRNFHLYKGIKRNQWLIWKMAYYSSVKKMCKMRLKSFVVTERKKANTHQGHSKRVQNHPEGAPTGQARTVCMSITITAIQILKSMKVI